MIKNLTIQNFQSHKKTELDFDDGINIIIGQSDSGKSAIIRALNWVINNKPSGEAFKSKWGGDTKAIIDIDAYKILREKAKSNLYAIYTGEQTARTPFLSFGQNVPENVKKLLNFSSLNIANQFDSPFLLAMSGGEVASYLNEIVNLDKIDTSLANINKSLKGEKTLLEKAKSELEATQIRLRGFDHLSEAEALLIEIEDLDNEVHEKKVNHKILSETLESIEYCQEELKKLSVVDCQKDIVSIEKDLADLMKKRWKLSDLTSTLSTLTDIQTDLDWNRIELEEEKDKFEELMPEQCPLCGAEQ